MLSTVLLIVSICITVAAFIYFFYFNRVIAWFLGLAIRLFYWNDGASSIWLEIGELSWSPHFLALISCPGSIHFSILTGRILLKDVHYHSSNQTAKIVKAQVAWRYWIRRPTKENEIGLSLGGDGVSSSTGKLDILILHQWQMASPFATHLVEFRWLFADLSGSCTTELLPLTTYYHKCELNPRRIQKDVLRCKSLPVGFFVTVPYPGLDNLQIWIYPFRHFSPARSGLVRQLFSLDYQYGFENNFQILTPRIYYHWASKYPRVQSFAGTLPLQTCWSLNSTV